MACLTIPDQNKRIENAEALHAFLEPFEIWYEQFRCDLGWLRDEFEVRRLRHGVLRPAP
jgi:hypothetical protein